MTDPYAALRDAIKARPTPGPWFSETDARRFGGIVRAGPLQHYERGSIRDQLLMVCGERQRVDADYIAAANPATIAALLADLDAAMEDARRYKYAREFHILGEHLETGKVHFCGDNEALDEVLDAAIDAAMKQVDA